MASYDETQIANARVIYDFWFAKTKSEIVAAGWVADADRECSLNPKLIGDHGTAFGLAQHHIARVKSIKAGIGIDMRTAPLADQCAGIFWEVSKGPYRAILPALVAAPTAWSVNAILIGRFEQSADHTRDLERQLPMAAHWLTVFGGRA